MQLPEHIRQAIVPIHRAGWPFIGCGLVLAILLGLLAAPLFWLGLLVTAWMIYFFRDPPRVSPQGDEIVVSPADGVVQAVTERRPPPEMELGDVPRTCISVFLNVFDVHVSRAPVGGRIARLAYHPGKFLNAAGDKASDENGTFDEVISYDVPGQGRDLNNTIKILLQSPDGAGEQKFALYTPNKIISKETMTQDSCWDLDILKK